jgi:hypothetical protein
MRLYDEIVHSEGWASFAGARVLYLPLCAVYFEGVKGLGDFSGERMDVYLPSCVLSVEGECLSIGKYSDGDLSVLGKIRSLSVKE